MTKIDQKKNQIQTKKPHQNKPGGRPQGVGEPHRRHGQPIWVESSKKEGVYEEREKKKSEMDGKYAFVSKNNHPFMREKN